MSRITLTIDSATNAEADAFIFAFQRTRHFGLPAQITTEPTVRKAGEGWGITTPAMDVDRAHAMMLDFAVNTAAVKV